MDPSRKPDLLMIASFDLHLRSEGKSKNTTMIYTLAALMLTRWTDDNDRPLLHELSRTDLKAYVAWMRSDARKRDGQPYSIGYINNQYRALQAFFKWLEAEEDVQSPMTGMRPPKVDQKLTPVLNDKEIADLLAAASKGKSFEARRDYALMRVFLSSGGRLSELTNLRLVDVDVRTGSAVVTGKGNKQRTVRFDNRTAAAVDRYIRVRDGHRLADSPMLWLPIKGFKPLAPNGVRQIIRRRAKAAGLKINPHMFRHTFSHRWLDAGGAEGDLMELNGWSSPAMLRHYGRSAASARARRSYDRVNPLGGI